MGKFTLVLGPMFSGKTTELIRRCRRMMAIGKKVIIFNHKKDNRNGMHTVSTHDGVKLKAMSVDMITTHWLNEFVKEYDVIAFDEGQFFGGLRDAVNFLRKDMGKVVIVAGLSGDVEMNPWPVISSLIPMAGEIIHCRALCVKCHRPAAFTKKLIPGGDRIDVGGKEKYMACCFDCYNI